MLDFLAREAHFLDHLAPMWRALPEQLRGRFYVAGELVDRAIAAGIAPTTPPLPTTDHLVVVASYRDLKLARRAGRLCVLCEHGAGQSYLGTRSGSYIGAPDRASVVAVIVPGPKQAQRHTLAYPTIPAYAVGVPKLDELHRRRRRRRRKQLVVALSFHWLSKVAPEARGSHVHYRQAFRSLAEQFSIIGHGHPRMLEQLIPHYEEAGIEVVRDFTEVIDRADVFCCDNSSAMYEWASLDRPVVVLNAPWFRRRVEHGLRFWEFADLGPQVDRREDLAVAIECAAADPPEIAQRRREIVSAVYEACDGRAAQRTAAALGELQEEWKSDRGAMRRRVAHLHPTRRANGRPIADRNVYGYRGGVRYLVAAKGQPIPKELV